MASNAWYAVPCVSSRSHDLPPWPCPTRWVTTSRQHFVDLLTVENSVIGAKTSTSGGCWINDRANFPQCTDISTLTYLFQASRDTRNPHGVPVRKELPLSTLKQNSARFNVAEQPQDSQDITCVIGATNSRSFSSLSFVRLRFFFFFNLIRLQTQPGHRKRCRLQLYKYRGPCPFF